MDNVVAWVKTHTGILLVVVLGLAAGFIFLKKPAPASGTTSTAGMSGLATDASGHPIVYRDVADEFVNINTNTYNTVAHNHTQPGPSAPSNPPSSPGGAGEHPIEPALEEEGIIRPQVGNLGNPGGIPVRSGPAVPAVPDQNIISHLPYGSQVAITGNPVSGSSNNPASGGPSSDLWYPVITSSGQSGYVSSYDVSNILNQPSNASGTIHQVNTKTQTTTGGQG